jgi:hypothetical protein
MSHTVMSHTACVQLEPRVGACHTLSCQEEGITVVKYVGTLRGGGIIFVDIPGRFWSSLFCTNTGLRVWILFFVSSLFL